MAHFNGNLFSPYSYGRFGGITFGVDNNLEMKVRSKKDTGANAIKKIRLIDGFGFTSAYNFLKSDSLKLQPFNLYIRSTLFEKINITAQGVLDPYEKNSSGLSINRFLWQGNHFSPGVNNGSIAISSSFQSKPRDPNKQQTTPSRQITDPALLSDQMRLSGI